MKIKQSKLPEVFNVLVNGEKIGQIVFASKNPYAPFASSYGVSRYHFFMLGNKNVTQKGQLYLTKESAAKGLIELWQSSI